MGIGEFLGSLKPKTWYQAILYLGVVLLALSLTVTVKVVSNVELFVLAAGLVLVGTGEWKRESSRYAPGGRRRDPVSCLIELAGVLLVALAILNVLGRIDLFV